MKIAVLKFGGTSMSSESSREKVVEKIIEKYNQGYKTLVVVSAMGRIGDPYATDTLIEMINPGAVTNKERDLLLSCGEIISAVVLANHISLKGYRASVLTAYQAGIETDDNFGNAEIINVYPDRILKSLDENNITIVTGFQGKTKNGEITTLGRGGSDITAIALAKAVKSNHVEIFTDVDGIMTADPNMVADAKVLKNMCYSEVYYLAENGAKVIHPKAIEMAQEFDIPLIIKNTYSDNEGTYIKAMDAQFIHDRKKLFNKGIIISLTYKKNRAQLIITLEDSKRDLGSLIEKIALENINLDIINFLPSKKILTIDMRDKDKLVNLLEKENFDYEIIKNCCKLSILGYKIKDNPEIIARIIKALSSENISILQISDPNNTFSCLIKEEDTNKALAILHKEFKLHD